MVDDWPGFGTILQVSDIDPYYNWVRFEWSLNNIRLEHKNNVIKYISFFDYSFNYFGSNWKISVFQDIRKI